MQVETQILDLAIPKTQGPVKRRRGFGSGQSNSPKAPQSRETAKAADKPAGNFAGERPQSPSNQTYMWSGAEEVQAEDEDEDEDEDSVLSIDALASIRAEPRRPSGARWRSRAVNEVPAAAPARLRASTLPPSTSRRGNHDYAVAEMLRKSTVLVRGKPGSATPTGQGSDLYTNPGASLARRGASRPRGFPGWAAGEMRRRLC